MSDMSPQEQLMLELINRARMDPNGEAKRFHIQLNEGVRGGDKISQAPKQVLAGNDDLLQAANAHSTWMLDKDKFSHTETGGGGTGRNPEDRIFAAGYGPIDGFTSGENIAFSGSTRSLNLTKEIINQYKDLFVDKGVDGRGHRVNILRDVFQEVGIGQEEGKFKQGGTNFNASMVTQDFGKIGNNVFITGVVYNDTVKNDNFYSVGESALTAGRNVLSAGATTDATGIGGGYELQFNSNAGPKTVTFDLTGGAVTVSLLLGATNIKIDVVNGNEVWTDASVNLTSSNVTEIHALGIRKVDFDGANTAQAMYGNRADNILRGNGGNDTLNGGGGVDELYGGANSDTFVFGKGDTGKAAKADVIADFSVLEDTINVDPMDANSKKRNDQDFSFIDSQNFHHKAGELRAYDNGTDTLVQGDVNGDGKADFVIRLVGHHVLVGGHFDL